MPSENCFVCMTLPTFVLILLIIIFGGIYGGEKNLSDKFHTDAKIINVVVIQKLDGKIVTYDMITKNNVTCQVTQVLNEEENVLKIGDDVSVTPSDKGIGTCSLYKSAGNDSDKFLTGIIIMCAMLGIMALVWLIVCLVSCFSDQGCRIMCCSGSYCICCGE